MSYSEVCVIGAIEIGASSEFHALALLVDIGTFDVLGASVDGLVGRILSSAAVVEAYKYGAQNEALLEVSGVIL